MTLSPGVEAKSVSKNQYTEVYKTFIWLHVKKSLQSKTANKLKGKYSSSFRIHNIIMFSTIMDDVSYFQATAIHSEVFGELTIMRYLTAEKERSMIVFTTASLRGKSTAVNVYKQSQSVQSTDSCCRSKKRSAWAHVQEERQKADARQISHQIGLKMYVQQMCRQTSWQRGGHERVRTGVDGRTSSDRREERGSSERPESWTEEVDWKDTKPTVGRTDS